MKGKRPEGCILCLVTAGSDEVMNLTVYKAQDVTVCLNLYPYNPGHLLVYPNRHVKDIRELTLAEILSINSILRLALTVLDREYQPSGYNIGCNMGLNAGASIEHLHYHIIPRYPREVGIAELLAGKRVLVEHPQDSLHRLQTAFMEAAVKRSEDE
ncbi:MAG: HIT domain-containing protein [Termitinemataceae bacterium]